MPLLLLRQLIAILIVKADTKHASKDAACNSLREVIEVDLLVDASGPYENGIECVWVVRSHDQQTLFRGSNAVDDVEQPTSRFLGSCLT